MTLLPIVSARRQQCGRIASERDSAGGAWPDESQRQTGVRRPIVREYLAALKLPNQEFSPHFLYGAKPSGEDEV